MNVEICRECLKNDLRNIFCCELGGERFNCFDVVKSVDGVHFLYLRYGRKTPYETSCTTIVSPRVLLDKTRMIKKDLKKVELIDKRCPYFLEHFLYDNLEKR